jgi:hypothetical protein
MECERRAKYCVGDEEGAKGHNQLQDQGLQHLTMHLGSFWRHRLFLGVQSLQTKNGLLLNFIIFDEKVKFSQDILINFC